MKYSIIIWWFSLLNKWFNFKPNNIFIKLHSCRKIVLSDIITREYWSTNLFHLEEDICDTNSTRLTLLFRLHTIYDEIMNDRIWINNFNFLVWNKFQSYEDEFLQDMDTYKISTKSLVIDEFLYNITQIIYCRHSTNDEKQEAFNNIAPRFKLFDSVKWYDKDTLNDICKVKFNNQNSIHNKYYRNTISDLYQMNIRYDKLPEKLIIEIKPKFKSNILVTGVFDVSYIFIDKTKESDLVTADEYLIKFLKSALIILIMTNLSDKKLPIIKLENINIELIKAELL